MKAEVLLAIFVLITTRITIHTSCVDIKQNGIPPSREHSRFVNTSQKIWTVRTTNRAFVKCEADQMKSIPPLSIDFVRSSSIMGTSRNLRILGVFDSQHKKRMTLFYKGNIVYYDLRVTNSSISQRPRPSCRNFFSRIIGMEPHFVVYSSRCQQIMRAEK
ncbi:uncharacterized protein LOC142771415 isoform X3 [Rhipicephalus microplus]|uniref:uncharacterized protein LOC142771415 isoform X3 n=1 Tax=Rhipicephalus microplus TaxID=6941 RepID=UPI003F6B8BC1